MSSDFVPARGRMADLVTRFTGRRPPPAPAPPARPAINIATICHTLEASQTQLVGMADRPMSAGARAAYEAAMCAVMDALEVARGDDIATLDGLLTRAVRADVRRTYARQLRSMRAHFNTRVLDALERARAALREAHRAVEAGERAAVAAPIEQPTRALPEPSPRPRARKAVTA